ncbi:hypothetical protein M0R45_036000 [Rubus argutus]|uniref:Uncharacterized protein n=1 Tax=Rubus argutus TaxID=59490 RepID=A0AAW1VYM1_RUBAR
MSTLQITSCKPSICFRNTSDYLHLSSKPYILPIHAKHLVRNPLVASRNASTQQQCMPVLKNQQCLYQQSLPVCLFSGKGKNGSDDEGSPCSGSGGGGSGGADRSGGSEDEGFAGIIDETLQVILATLGFIFLYVYIISGEEWTRLAKDYLKYLFSGSESVRLKRAMYKWGRFYQKLTEKKVYDKFWLEKAIISTPTWWDSPVKYRHLLRSYLELNLDQ